MTERDRIIAMAVECGAHGSLPGRVVMHFEQVEAFYYAVRREALSNVKVNIPTATMEQEFSNYHRLGYDKGRKEAFEQAAKILDNGHFLTDTSPEKKWAEQVAKAIRQLIKE